MLCETDGAFGPIRVLENDDMRALFIGEQCQGAAMLHADDGGPRPGPFTGSPYMKGWLLAGVRTQRGRGLMLGLGSGAGAVLLLSCFPALSLRVVEIDATLVEVALQWFPRLADLRRTGRLEIVRAEARELVLNDRDPPYDFVLVDLFTGTPEAPPLLRDPGALARLCARTRHLLVNATFTLGREDERPWLEPFAKARMPIVTRYPIGAPEQWLERPHNWILSTHPVVPPPGFRPFAATTGVLAEALRREFATMCARALPVS